MSKSQESFNKKEVRKRKEKKRKEKEMKRQAKKEKEKKSGLDDMIAYVDEYGKITSTPPDPGKKKDVKLDEIEIGVANRGTDEKKDPVRKGIVSMFDESKGYGFIKELETQERIFVHIKNLTEEIKEGNLVSYEVEKGAKGLNAVKVKLEK